VVREIEDQLAHTLASSDYGPVRIWTIQEMTHLRGPPFIWSRKKCAAGEGPYIYCLSTVRLGSSQSTIFEMHRISPLATIVPKIISPKPVSLTSTKKLLYISIEEVEAANTAQKAWVAISNKVYDVTSFVNKHPGGRDFLLAAVGRDATAVFKSLHSAKNTRILK
jgi:predicted heme/steroid binding protein